MELKRVLLEICLMSVVVIQVIQYKPVRRATLVNRTESAVHLPLLALCNAYTQVALQVILVSSSYHQILILPECLLTDLTAHVIIHNSQRIPCLCTCLFGVVGYHVCLTRTRSPVRTWQGTSCIA